MDKWQFRKVFVVGVDVCLGCYFDFLKLLFNLDVWSVCIGKFHSHPDCALVTISLDDDIIKLNFQLGLILRINENVKLPYFIVCFRNRV